MRNNIAYKLSVFIFAFPALVIYTAFVVYPLFPTLLISFQKHDGFFSKGFVGIRNYSDVVSSPEFLFSNYNTFKCVVISTFIALPLSLFLAIFLDHQTEGLRRFFKLSSLMPYILSVTVIAQLWILIYQPQWGMLDTILNKMGLQSGPKEWLGDESTAFNSLIITYLWQYFGFTTLLFYTGIKSVPKTYYEAALIDGATFFQTIVKITIPLLQEIIKFLLTVTIINCMGMFAVVRIMTNGGPGYSSRSIVYQLYYVAFEVQNFGQGCAIAILFIIECLLVTFLINSIIAKEKLEY